MVLSDRLKQKAKGVFIWLSFLYSTTINNVTERELFREGFADSNYLTRCLIQHVIKHLIKSHEQRHEDCEHISTLPHSNCSCYCDLKSTVATVT